MPRIFDTIDASLLSAKMGSESQLEPISMYDRYFGLFPVSCSVGSSGCGWRMTTKR